MIIQINGKKADIQLEHEKTVGDVLTAMDSWLNGTNSRLSGMNIDGKAVKTSDMDDFFYRELNTIESIDILTSSIQELFAEALLVLVCDINVYETASFAEKSTFLERWRDSPSAAMFAEQSPDIFLWAEKTFSGEGCGTQALRIIVDERLRELDEPKEELQRSASLIAEVCARLEELPLDMQTGKETRATETISSFSGVAEKIFRIITILAVRNTSLTTYISEFNAALKELLAAYEQRDTVLIGDLAEYEMAPRLRSLYAAVVDCLQSEDCTSEGT